MASGRNSDKGIRLALLAACVALAVGCTETLPPRDDPTDFLATSLAFGSRLVIIDSGQVVQGRRFVASAKNLYKDVLDEKAAVGGYIDVWLRGRPEISRRLPIGGGDIVNPRMLYGDRLAIGVDSAASFAVLWDQRTDSGEAFWGRAPGYRRYSTPQGTIYYESDSVRFVATGSLKLFEKLPPMPLPTVEFTFVYQLWKMVPPTPT